MSAGTLLEWEKLKLEREKLRYDLAKLLVSVLIGTVGVAVMNYNFQIRQLEQQKLQDAAELQLQQEKTRTELQLQQEQAKAERRKAEMEYLGKYLDNALQDDIVRRLRFAEYFARLTVSEDLKKEWEQYSEDLKAIKDEATNKLPQLKDRVAVLEDEGEMELAGELKRQILRLEWESPLEEIAPLPKATQVRQTTFVQVPYKEPDFEAQGEVVVDHANGLMWQQSGSAHAMPFSVAQQYIQQLNTSKFAGYDDWRLPTIEELGTLGEPEKQSTGLYISPIFDETQAACWGGSKVLPELARGINFFDNTVLWDFRGISLYVRAIRSL